MGCITLCNEWSVRLPGAARLVDRQKAIDQFQRSLGCALLQQNQTFCILAERVACVGREAILNCRFEFVKIADLASSVCIEKLLDDGFEVPDVRAEEDGAAVGGRFDHVLAAALPVEAAADECDVGEAPGGS